MSEKYLARSEPTFSIIVLLTLVAASVVIIVIRLIYTITLSAPGLVVFASYLLSLTLMVLSGALLFQKPWSLFPLSLAGKGYFLLTIVLLLVRAENIFDIAWLSTAMGSIYLASLNYINPLRKYVGESRVSGRFVAGRVATGILLFVTCMTLYTVLISNLFPEYAYRISPKDFSDLVLGSDAGDFPAHTWSERWRVAVLEDLIPLERDVGIGVWTNRQGEKIIVTPGVWSQQVEKSAFLGFTGPYKFEKAVWKAGIGQPFLMVLKMNMADEGTKVYLLEIPTVKSIVVLKHVEYLSLSTWVASANIYPKDEQPYSIESSSKSLERALLPIHITLHKFRDQP
jgi:hypothetical protein